MRTNGGIDPHAEERADISFMQTLMRGHADAAWAMLEMKMIVHLTSYGRQHGSNLEERLARAARKFRSAAEHIERARSRVP